MDNQGTVVDGKVNIADGTIDGSKVAFTVVRDMNGAQITRKFSGTVAGAELKLTAETVGGPGGGGGPGDGVQEAIAWMFEQEQQLQFNLDSLPAKGSGHWSDYVIGVAKTLSNA